MRLLPTQRRPATRYGRVIAAALAAVTLSSAALTVTGTAAAHVQQPTLTAQHAFVGDPLWGLDTGTGTLLGLLPDERTAQASTTKLMTLHLTVLALEEGKVQLGDQVTINATEAGIGGSTMADMNGVSLEEGEVVSLETLIRGMMYPSGNNAAWAIARHVAEAYLGSGATAADFVAMMNQHAAAEGLVDTQFTNPNGFDDPFQSGVTPAPNEYNHYTTARELAKLIAHAIQDPYFQQVVGFNGTYSDTTTGAPSGPKSYSWGWGFNYPGWEGAKGGGTQNCNGPNNGCMAMSAKRIGRRVVLAFMQGQPWTEEPGLFDFGFASIFHPDARGVSLPVANVERQDVTCLQGGRAVTATLSAIGNASVSVWDADVDAATLTKVAQAAVPSTQKGGGGIGKGPFDNVAVAALPNGDVVVAVRKGANEELSWWTIAPDGTPTLVADGAKSGPAESFAIQPISSTRFLTVAVNPDGVLVVKSWELGQGAITQLASFEDASRTYVEAAAAAPLAFDIFSGHQAFTVASTETLSAMHTWSLDASGVITRLGELTINGTRRSLSAAALPVQPVYEGELFPPAYYAVGYRAGGSLAVRFFRIANDGTPVAEGLANGFGVAAEDVRVAGLGIGGVIAATREAGGAVELTVLDTPRQADNSVASDVIAAHSAFDSASLDMCKLFSSQSEGDYVTSSTGADGQLRLRAFRSGDRP